MLSSKYRFFTRSLVFFEALLRLWSSSAYVENILLTTFTSSHLTGWFHSTRWYYTTLWKSTKPGRRTSDPTWGTFQGKECHHICDGCLIAMHSINNYWALLCMVEYGDSDEMAKAVNTYHTPHSAQASRQAVGFWFQCFGHRFTGQGGQVGAPKFCSAT